MLDLADGRHGARLIILVPSAAIHDVLGAMKTLLVLRHAKSSWQRPGLSDHERPLNARGTRDAPRMGRLLAERRLEPDVIASSTATRARLTADAVRARCGCAGAVLADRRLYLAGPGDVVEVVREVGGGATRVLVVGHNPTLEALVAGLSGRAESMPPAALAHIELEIDNWHDLRLTTAGRLVDLWRPKELDDDR